MWPVLGIGRWDPGMTGPGIETRGSTQLSLLSGQDGEAPEGQTEQG